MVTTQCPKCGTLYPDRFTFCKVDGTELIPLPPEVASAEPSAVPVPKYKLFDSGAIFLATLFGSPIAGTVLMAINYARMGAKKWIFPTILAGVAITALAVLIGEVLPQSAGSAIGVVLLMSVWRSAKALQGPDVEFHKTQGGKLGSKWAAFGIGLSVGCASFVLAVAGVVLFQFVRDANSKVIIGTRDEVTYSRPATEQDARALGKALKDDGYFQDKGVSVLISKDTVGTIVAFLVRDSAWNEPRMISTFEEIGREIAPSVGGFPIRVRMSNSARETKREMTVGEAFVGAKDHIYYFGSATAADAASLGSALQSEGYFRNEGFTAVLARDDQKTRIGFAVPDGNWNNQQQVAAFEGIVRHTASSVGGLPVTLDFLNAYMDIKKEELLER